jgi:hypothetical protein
VSARVLHKHNTRDGHSVKAAANQLNRWNAQALRKPLVRYASVTAVTASTGLATLTFAGSSNPVAGVPSLQTYNPVAGDVAAVLQSGSDLLILGTYGGNSWTTVTSFTNSWTSAASPSQVAYTKRNGIVYLKGNLNSGGTAGSAAFTLPAGFRPTYGQDFVCAGGAFGAAQQNVIVASTGSVTPYASVGYDLGSVFFFVT